ncbi:SEC-C domain-containing protein [Candidatus Babeliales bacterium]|nr:SEC-C domain-containing protein [Candidatus Babeliales bacterium]
MIYGLRHDVLKDASNIEKITEEFIKNMVTDLVMAHCPDEMISQAQYSEVLKQVSITLGIGEQELQQDVIFITNRSNFIHSLTGVIIARYYVLRNQIDKEKVEMMEKWIMLETIDQAWKQHMINIDHLKEGIGLRGWGQKNPLIEYKREAFEMFEDMMRQIHADIVHHVFHIKPEMFDQSRLIARRQKELDQIKMQASDNAKSETENEPAKRDDDRVGRNEPCSCGSGKKYKKCCG